MQISLLDNEIELILNAIKNDKFWIADSIRGKIATGMEFRKERAECKHKEGTYIGLKQCCSKCNGVWKVGQGEAWSLLSKEDKKEVLKALKKIGLTEAKTEEEKIDKQIGQLGLIGEK